MNPTLRSSRIWLWLGVLALGLVGVAAASYFTSASITRRVHKHSDPNSPSFRPPSDAQTAAVKLDYPKSTGRAVATIATTYNASKDRTKTTIEIKDLKPAPAASMSANVISINLKLNSEFSGKVRPADHGEASLDCELIVKSKSPGTLTAADAPGTIELDGVSSPLHHPAKGKPPFATDTQPTHTSETIRFRIHTSRLLKALSAQTVALKFGTVQVLLTTEQIADLREFSSKLDPTP